MKLCFSSHHFVIQPLQIDTLAYLREFHTPNIPLLKQTFGGPFGTLTLRSTLGGHRVKLQLSVSWALSPNTAATDHVSY